MLLIPASNEKLVTSSVMLEQLGPDYRYRTTYGVRGTLASDTLHGDLVVIGRGSARAPRRSAIFWASVVLPTWRGPRSPTTENSSSAVSTRG